MMRPSECMWSGRAGRRAGTQRRQVNIDSTQSELGRGRRQKLRAYLSPTCCTRQTSGDREAQGRKNAAYRQGCRLAESRVGIWRAMLATSNHREAVLLATISHQEGLRVLRRFHIKQDASGRDAPVGVRHTCATACAVAFWNAAKTVEHRFNAVKARAG